MQTLLSVIQIVVSVLLIATILIQQRGEGLSSVFGGGESIYQTRRGIEKWLHYATIVLAVLFLVSAFANLVI
ncbi:preprotein translocase subunit SecG [Candidatus Azambacteria bacterium RIFCSPHIGHO2_01_46_10]|uniref:Protein-export membrane protein SecG n=7 Tax=Candidatus Azamiibacteriota TaxID=1752741 RepID=A0A1F5C654_9BACT|nr:MAG: preprotein translocase subunit SecG [Candidatus Azambacteria bacterium GW2011_GWC1_46_13]KKU35263.1 MAG: Preprotein translocase, SecG subunit [Candidatus Azambacteria bacterium GW2011_GWB1_46_27]KKU38527.1 MAG: Preprotein translocase, SecG subunit [Candidatus Azambacteria bacterium GW2011_GWB2_46_37]OGD29549.1 MAG: preprotein translocase subunit SecG [Candidatus Azambacteria bacterium RIFCSPHIGHO2_02_46_12]OGD35615.1 MAG: preprotein translocase subunit SecG [Candidatus Azambacteria bact